MPKTLPQRLPHLHPQLSARFPTVANVHLTLIAKVLAFAAQLLKVKVGNGIAIQLEKCIAPHPSLILRTKKRLQTIFGLVSANQERVHHQLSSLRMEITATIPISAKIQRANAANFMNRGGKIKQRKVFVFNGQLICTYNQVLLQAVKEKYYT